MNNIFPFKGGYVIFRVTRSLQENGALPDLLKFFFFFIECFTTTFLRAHSWLNWVDEDDDEDEVGLKEKPEDTRYIKKITSK